MRYRCQHELIFPPRKTLGIPQDYFTGVCIKCGKKVKVPRSKYFKLIKKKEGEK